MSPVICYFSTQLHIILRVFHGLPGHPKALPKSPRMPLWWRKIQGTQAGSRFQLFVQMALWDTLGSGTDHRLAPELFAGTSQIITFYKGYSTSLGTCYNITFYKVFEQFAEIGVEVPETPANYV